MEAWLPSALSEARNRQNWAEEGAGQLAPASADASFRRYFRWSDGVHSLIIMDAPPEQEDVRPFMRIAGLLASAGVKTPAILAADPQQGFLLMEDLGACTYLQSIQAGITEAELEHMFAGAISTLVRWQASSRPAELPDYDEAVLRRELELFPDWFVGRHLQRELNAEQRADWVALCSVLLDSHLAESKVFVHRDYMPRNLMTAPGEPGVLDFQDALYGPASYDVTSLFADAFFNLPLAQRESWIQRYWQQARAAGIDLPERFDDFLSQSRLMGVQRHLKVLGIFARIRYRDGKPHYLEDAPRFIQYLREACSADARLAPLVRLLGSLEL
ncbi:aminoglycoside phosphotransferase family protein [Halopseudomonas litoralis]|uniref:aminoglycoside phosphotransferase family protein n=1 Tax=Halopseudomonas litoralis TaxID=797277 RepID=UPI001E378650|nr:phosphotransferase [Halopseudomonas litoralis]